MSHSIDTRQIAGTLRRCALLKELDVAELTTVAQLVEVHALDPQQQLYAPGDEGQSMHIVAQGKVEFFLPMQTRTRVVGVRGPVDAFGELSLLLPGPRMIGARAEQEATLYEMTHGSLKMLERSDPPLALKILEALRTRSAEVLSEVRPMVSSLFTETLGRVKKR